MKLSELQPNQNAIITKIDANEELMQRFYSFGIIKGEVIFVETMSLKKQTMEINVEDTMIALRVDEANTIEVKVL
jgi:ferrous iron transport protein A